MKKAGKKHSASRRQFVKKAAYVAPVILTLQAAPSYAKKGSGSEKPEKSDKPDKSDELDSPH
jgi:hypothetical protein